MVLTCRSLHVCYLLPVNGSQHLPTPLGEEFCTCPYARANADQARGSTRARRWHGAAVTDEGKAPHLSRGRIQNRPRPVPHVIQRGHSPRRIPLVDVGKRNPYFWILTSHFVLVPRLVSNRSRARGVFVQDDGKTRPQRRCAQDDGGRTKTKPPSHWAAGRLDIQAPRGFIILLFRIQRKIFSKRLAFFLKMCYIENAKQSS